MFKYWFFTWMDLIAQAQKENGNVALMVLAGWFFALFTYGNREAANIQAPPPTQEISDEEVLSQLEDVDPQP